MWLAMLLALCACESEPVPEAIDCPATPEPLAGRVRVAGIVLPWVRGDKGANLDRLEPRIREAASAGASIVCTTECALDGYAVTDADLTVTEYRAIGEEIPGGEAFARLAALARELELYLVVGMQERDGEVCHNTAVFLGPGGELLGKYHKQKLGFEVGRNEAGAGPLVVETDHGSLGVMICADRTEASIVSSLAEAGAELLLCPSGGVYGSRKNDPILQERSRESGLPILFVHPVEFLVTLPDGSIAARALRGERLFVDQQSPAADDEGRVYYFDFCLPY